MPVAELERSFHQLQALILLQRHCAKAEDRNTGAMTFDDIHAGNNLHETPHNVAGGPQHRRSPAAIPALAR